MPRKWTDDQKKVQADKMRNFWALKHRSSPTEHGHYRLQLDIDGQRISRELGEKELIEILLKLNGKEALNG